MNIQSTLNIKSPGSLTVCPVRINTMIGTLKCSYPGLSSDTMTDIMDQIQKSIRQKVSGVQLSRCVTDVVTVPAG